ncbi:imidazoleglycerol phosphate synthase, cyclase subunit [Kwoniella pini CBS 10737]|uniref:Imidazole glycerol phosphate synthase hisHF n=1 Tax=Kwoniella pini CBS 10737 TaxID=1296096 RepID=A0A1B9HU22_9TREE|nr:imidazoleglycerol phosphate synthase, cyclase subunit [Kwoniella pini CBS 10737]OCF46766.1 imidazoleglycerol phosphate synthase, cyclase subunit [Kwoniella pini CBS 10737]
MVQPKTDTILPIPEVDQPAGHVKDHKPKLYILDYGAGNVRSLANSIKKLGYEFEWIQDESDFDKAEKLIFPGVGSFEQAMNSLRSSGRYEQLQRYIKSGKPYFGICIGMQVLFESSEESKSTKGLGVVPFPIKKFSTEDLKGKKTVPHMGWNSTWRSFILEKEEEEEKLILDEDYYFVHSYAALLSENSDTDTDTKKELMQDYAYTLSRYGSETFISSIKKDNIFACQFHPEKSGPAGLDLLKKWLISSTDELSKSNFISINNGKKWQIENPNLKKRNNGNGLTNRIIACLDVRSNDKGDLVVTKGDQYDVRDSNSKEKEVRNLGKPVELAKRYYLEGADEIAFLNITSFRSSALFDQPMLDVIKKSAETVFVPLTIGGGIKDTIDPDGTFRSALEVAGLYFRSGADKISIGSEAVLSVEELLKNNNIPNGKSPIETISKGYGNQAVVVSIDPKRVYINTKENPNWKEDLKIKKHLDCLIYGDNSISKTSNEEKGKIWWYQCTISGGRDSRDLDVIQLSKGVEKLGAGEILLNSVDRDGSKKGFDLDLINLVKKNVNIPVVSSSGAGSTEDFLQVFTKTKTEAALAAGIFHRKEVEIDQVKLTLENNNLPVRRCGLDVI